MSTFLKVEQRLVRRVGRERKVDPKTITVVTGLGPAVGQPQLASSDLTPRRLLRAVFGEVGIPQRNTEPQSFPAAGKRADGWHDSRPFAGL